MKYLFYLSVLVFYGVVLTLFASVPTSYEMDAALNQMNHNVSEYTAVGLVKNTLLFLGPFGLLYLGYLMFKSDFKKLISYAKTLSKASMLLLPFLFMGCWKGYEPQKLEVINTYEEGFLLPFTEDGQKQTSSNNEEYLAKNLIYTQQIRIPQRWLQTGYGPGNGEWRDAALLIKVDKSPVTREWTADPATGTSDKNQAVWVMTADGVEFSTGWTCTARIMSKEDAVKFLHNYRNETLAQVLDTEVRAKIQTEFGMEVTDLHMQELRTNATPHLNKVIKSVEEFFTQRGITITNLGITGGFVYKDVSIMNTLVKVFNAEQDKNVAIAATQAQIEKNKKIQLEAEAEAKALLTKRQAEADGIKAVADAKVYEIESAKRDLVTYLQLKAIELTKIKLEKWDGKFPTYFMGTQSPELLLQVPEPTHDKSVAK